MPCTNNKQQNKIHHHLGLCPSVINRPHHSMASLCLRHWRHWRQHSASSAPMLTVLGIIIVSSSIELTICAISPSQFVSLPPILSLIFPPFCLPGWMSKGRPISTEFLFHSAAPNCSKAPASSTMQQRGRHIGQCRGKVALV